MTRSTPRSGLAGSDPVTAAPPAASPRVTLRAATAVLLILAAVAVMVRLSIWQWDRARARDSLLNYTYAAEWMIFAVLTVGGLIRLAHEGRRVAEAAEPEHRPDGPVIGPPLAPGEELPDVTLVRIRRRLGLDRPA